MQIEAELGHRRRTNNRSVQKEIFLALGLKLRYLLFTMIFNELAALRILSK